MILGHFADVIKRLDGWVGMDRLEQVILQQMTWRERGVVFVIADLERMQHAFAEDAIAEGDVAVAAAKEGQPQPIFGGKVSRLLEQKIGRAGRAPHRCARLVLPTAIFKYERPLQERINLVVGNTLVEFETYFSARGQLAE